MNPEARSTQLNVQQLYTFRHVYEQGGYAAAAAVSNLSVPTVWQQIRAVEKAYGVKLFRKTGRRVVPTPEADRLADSIDEILVGLESTFELTDDVSSRHAPLRLVVGNRMMLEDLATPFASFHAAYGNRLTIRHGNNKRAEDLLLSDEADMALSLEPGPDQSSRKIAYEAAYSVDFLAVAPNQHPFTKTKSGSLRELVKHPLIVTAPGTHGRDALEHALHREQLEADIVVETDNSGFTIACVQAGMGLGILAGRPDGQLCRQLVTRSLRRQLGTRRIVFMWRNGRQLTPSMKGLIDFIAKEMTE